MIRTSTCTRLSIVVIQDPILASAAIRRVSRALRGCIRRPSSSYLLEPTPDVAQLLVICEQGCQEGQPKHNSLHAVTVICAAMQLHPASLSVVGWTGQRQTVFAPLHAELRNVCADDVGTS
jgi:hypothetical protein